MERFYDDLLGRVITTLHSDLGCVEMAADGAEELPIVDIGSGINIHVVDDKNIFPFGVMTLPSVTWTTSLVAAPVPVNQLSINFSKKVPFFSNNMRDLKTFPSGWLHTPYVSIYFVTTCAVDKIKTKIKDEIVAWKSDLLGLINKKQPNLDRARQRKLPSGSKSPQRKGFAKSLSSAFPSSTKSSGNKVNKKQESGRDQTDAPNHNDTEQKVGNTEKSTSSTSETYKHAHNFIGTIIVFVPSFSLMEKEEEDDGMGAIEVGGARSTGEQQVEEKVQLKVYTEKEKKRMISSTEQALKQICLKSGGNPTYDLFKQDGYDVFQQKWENSKSQSEKVEAQTAFWNGLVFRIVDSATKSFLLKCGMFTDHMEKLEKQAHIPGWNVANYFLMKESLALMHVQVNLVTVALQLYSDIKAFFQMLKRSSNGALPGISSKPSTTLSPKTKRGKRVDGGAKQKKHLLKCHLDPKIHVKIRRGNVNLMEILGYLFSREVSMLEYIGIHDQIHIRAEAFLKNARVLCKRHDSKPKEYRPMNDPQDSPGKSLTPIDVWTVALVVAVVDKVTEYNIYKSMTRSQKVQYASLLMIGRASAIEVGQCMYGSKTLEWLHAAGSLVDPIDGQMENCEGQDQVGAGAAATRERVLPTFDDIRILGFDSRTEEMVLSVKGFIKVLRDLFILPALRVYEELSQLTGQPKGNTIVISYKRHAVILYSDMASILVTGGNFAGAVKYFKQIDKVYIQDGWKRAEAVNTTWLAYCYRKLSNTNGFIDSAMSLLHPPILEACPEMLPSILPHVLDELPRAVVNAREENESERTSSETVNSRYSFSEHERRSSGQGFLALKFPPLKGAGEIEEVPRVAVTTGTWTLHFDVQNCTNEPLRVSDIIVTLCRLDSMNGSTGYADLNIASKNAPATNTMKVTGTCVDGKINDAGGTLARGSNRFSVNYSFEEAGCYCVKTVSVYIGDGLRFDLNTKQKSFIGLDSPKNIFYKRLCKRFCVDIYDPSLITRPTLKLKPVIKRINATLCAIKVGLEFVPAIDENSMGVDNTPCIHVVESHMENLQIVNRPAQALYPLVLHNNDQAALTYTFQCPSSEGNETGIKIIVKYKFSNDADGEMSDTCIAECTASMPRVNKPDVFPVATNICSAHASVEIPKYGIVGDPISLLIKLNIPAVSLPATHDDLITTRKYVLKCAPTLGNLWMIRGYKTKIIKKLDRYELRQGEEIVCSETISIVPLKVGRLPAPECTVEQIDEIQFDDGTCKSTKCEQSAVKVLKYVKRSSPSSCDTTTKLSGYHNEGILVVSTGVSVIPMGEAAEILPR